LAGSGGSPLGGGGPGGLGGAANADFDSLIDLIISTVDHDSWMENGTGEGEIQPFPTNLSLVISQTQRVHEQIADLLEQLRRLQDLQVTIEVRFIRLTDSFFERIGVDFDFNIEDRSGLPPNSLVPGQPTEGFGASATVGLNPSTSITDFPNYTVDLDLPFRQESFGLSEPQFGTPVDVATFGFAILSDIEAFFLIEASQGDRRSNVLQAPKVTLFNGQQAQVIDSAFRPFVISVIPVVGEFAAAQQPVIVVLSEGTMLSVQAVVSEDRRYVRLTLVPFFSQIGEVQEFTFEGTETTSTSSSESTDGQDDESSEEAEEITRSGTTVQLPTFEVISVSTTVSVPDGGTVLLGGIKRLVEGRNEFGVPLLSKIPYVDRLFRNVGIGRETDSLMMMVTPHIIIQEEEEARLGIAEE
jgi:general secretion pathway protein D